MEKFVEGKKDTIDYTFVRPSVLDDARTDKYKLEKDSFFLQGGPMPRSALAAFIVKECVKENKFVGSGVAVGGVD